jgi:hypothetical protein
MRWRDWVIFYPRLVGTALQSYDENEQRKTAFAKGRQQAGGYSDGDTSPETVATVG